VKTSHLKEVNGQFGVILIMTATRNTKHVVIMLLLLIIISITIAILIGAFHAYSKEATAI